MYTEAFLLRVACARSGHRTLAIQEDVSCPFKCLACGRELRPGQTEIPVVIEFLTNWRTARKMREEMEYFFSICVTQWIVGGTVELCDHTLEVIEERTEAR